MAPFIGEHTLDIPSGTLDDIAKRVISDQRSDHIPSALVKRTRIPPVSVKPPSGVAPLTRAPYDHRINGERGNYHYTDEELDHLSKEQRRDLIETLHQDLLELPHVYPDRLRDSINLLWNRAMRGDILISLFT